MTKGINTGGNSFFGLNITAVLTQLYASVETFHCQWYCRWSMRFSSWYVSFSFIDIHWLMTRVIDIAFGWWQQLWLLAILLYVLAFNCRWMVLAHACFKLLLIHGNSQIELILYWLQVCLNYTSFICTGIEQVVQESALLFHCLPWHHHSLLSLQICKSKRVIPR